MNFKYCLSESMILLLKSFNKDTYVILDRQWLKVYCSQLDNCHFKKTVWQKKNFLKKSLFFFRNSIYSCLQINIPGTLLIIGIVFVILIAIILIIVIVFKMRTHSEASVKVVESKSYSVDPSTPPVLSSTQVKPVKTNNNKPVKEWYV